MARVKPKKKNDLVVKESVNVNQYNKYVYIVIILFSFLLYGNSIKNKYALDDAIVITENDFTKKGFSGIGDILSTELFTGFFKQQKNLVEGGRYRPFSLITYAIEYQFFGKNPHISHFINILLYGVSGILLFIVLTYFFPPENRKWYFSFAFIASLLWIAHPLHTEVVANIKGRDEILTLIFSLWTVKLSFDYLRTKKLYLLLVSFVVFFFALMSKEMAVTFVAVIPLSVYFFTKSKYKETISIKLVFDYLKTKKPYLLAVSFIVFFFALMSKETVVAYVAFVAAVLTSIYYLIKSKYKETIIALLPILAATVIFFIIRRMVIGEGSTDIPKELMNDSFLGLSFSEKYATISATLGIYLKLLFFPNTLTFDYYPYHVQIASWGDLRAIIPLVIYLVLGFYALFTLKKKSVVSFGIWFYIITFSIVSNVLFPIGVFANERFMYMPSIGFVIIVTYLLIKAVGFIKDKKTSTMALSGVVLLILSLFTIKTISRNPAWENDFILFTTDVKTSVNGAKSNVSAGGKLLEESQKLKKIISENPSSIKILKTKLDNSTMLSSSQKNELLKSDNLQSSLIKIEETRTEFVNLSVKYLEKAIEVHPTYVDALLLLGNANFEKDKKDVQKVWEYYERILKHNPYYDKVYTNMTMILNDSINVDTRIRVLEEMYAYNKNSFDICYSLGNLYGRYKNDFVKSLIYLERSVQLRPHDSRAYKDLGIAYGMSSQFEKAISTMEKSIELNPKDKQTIINLGLTYQNMGNNEKAKYYFGLAEQVK